MKAEISTAEPPAVSWEVVPRKGSNCNESPTDSTAEATSLEAAMAGEALKETTAKPEPIATASTTEELTAQQSAAEEPTKEHTAVENLPVVEESVTEEPIIEAPTEGLTPRLLKNLRSLKHLL